MCMLPAQYHVWLAIFTPLIADKFSVRTKEYIKQQVCSLRKREQSTQGDVLKKAGLSFNVYNLSAIQLDEDKDTYFAKSE